MGGVVDGPQFVSSVHKLMKKFGFSFACEASQGME